MNTASESRALLVYEAETLLTGEVMLRVDSTPPCVVAVGSSQRIGELAAGLSMTELADRLRGPMTMGLVLSDHVVREMVDECRNRGVWTLFALPGTDEATAAFAALGFEYVPGLGCYTLRLSPHTSKA